MYPQAAVVSTVAGKASKSSMRAGSRVIANGSSRRYGDAATRQRAA